MSRQKVAHLLWRFYRIFIFPFIQALSGGGGAQACRHDPSCSEYGLRQVQEHGWLRGGWAAIRRISTCHPWAAVDRKPGRK